MTHRESLKDGGKICMHAGGANGLRAGAEIPHIKFAPEKPKAPREGGARQL